MRKFTEEERCIMQERNILPHPTILSTVSNHCFGDLVGSTSVIQLLLQEPSHWLMFSYFWPFHRLATSNHRSTITCFLQRGSPSVEMHKIYPNHFNPFWFSISFVKNGPWTRNLHLTCELQTFSTIFHQYYGENSVHKPKVSHICSQKPCI